MTSTNSTNIPYKTRAIYTNTTTLSITLAHISSIQKSRVPKQIHQQTHRLYNRNRHVEWIQKEVIAGKRALWYPGGYKHHWPSVVGLRHNFVKNVTALRTMLF